MRKLPSVLLLLLLCSCTAVSSFIHDDQVVARLGENRLYRSQLEKYIPALASPEDSARLAEQYISTWARDILYMNVAEEQLSKSDLDVASELEAYRRSLLKYRYEQHYINSRLDTLVTEDQIASYYEAHRASFELSRPILKLRFLDVMKDSPYLETLERSLSDSDFADKALSDSLVYSSALKYLDRSEVWTDALVIAKEFGVDYAAMLSSMNGSYIRIESEDRGDIRMAYVCDIMRKGTAPVEFCADQIKDIILSVRKRELVDSLERDLLESALNHKQLVIYGQ